MFTKQMQHKMHQLPISFRKTFKMGREAQALRRSIRGGGADVGGPTISLRAFQMLKVGLSNSVNCTLVCTL